jgi:hypothetical protein
MSPKLKFSLSSVYWLCEDETFYREGIAILKQKNIFDYNFWAFSVRHKDLENMR